MRLSWTDLEDYWCCVFAKFSVEEGPARSHGAADENRLTGELREENGNPVDLDGNSVVGEIERVRAVGNAQPDSRQE